MLGLIDDQQDLELLGEGRRWSRLLHKPGGRRSCLLDHVGYGAEGAEEARGTSRGGWGLGLLGLLSHLGWASLLGSRDICRSLGRCRSFGRGLGGCHSWSFPLLGRGGGAGWRRSRWVRPLEIRHVAVRQVGHEAAVREAAPEEVHDCCRKVRFWGGQVVALWRCLSVSWLKEV